jgi:hypothetical protein
MTPQAAAHPSSLSACRRSARLTAVADSAAAISCVADDRIAGNRRPEATRRSETRSRHEEPASWGEPVRHVRLSSEAAPQYTNEGDLVAPAGGPRPFHSESDVGDATGLTMDGALQHEAMRKAAEARALLQQREHYAYQAQPAEAGHHHHLQQQQQQQELLLQQEAFQQQAAMQQLRHAVAQQHIAHQYAAMAPADPPSPSPGMPPYAYAPLAQPGLPAAPSPLPSRAALLALQLNRSSVNNLGNQMVLPPQKAPGGYPTEAAPVSPPLMQEYLAYLHSAMPPTAYAPSLPSRLSQYEYDYLVSAAPEVAAAVGQHLHLQQVQQHIHGLMQQQASHDQMQPSYAPQQYLQEPPQYLQEPAHALGHYGSHSAPLQPIHPPAASDPSSMFSTNKTAYYMEAGDPNPVLILPPSPHYGLAPYGYGGGNPGAAYGVSVAVVSMVKSPANFETWLSHHHQTLGVQRFYIRVEDTPALEPLLSSPPWNTLVEATFSSANERDYFEQMDRQSAHIARAIPAARAAGFTHLLHIDDDELIHCAAGAPALMRELASADPSRPDLHLHNVEALLPSPNCANPFTQARAFRHHPTKYCSYTNGKSFGRLSAAGLRSHGPHHFRSAGGAGGAQANVTHTIPAGVAVVLHFESATYAKWRTKYIDLARRHGATPDVFSRVPFRFYRESFDGALALLRAEAAVAHGALGAERARASAEEDAFNIWCRWKLEPHGLPVTPPLGQPPIVLTSGVTLLSPFPEQPPPGHIPEGRAVGAPHAC